MSAASVAIEWCGETLVLLHERAVWWPREKTLLIADPHFGKAATFRLAGIPVPETSHDDDIERLSRILAATGAPRLVILGDFLHARAGRSAGVLSTLAAWRARHSSVEMVLVRGNHDRHAGPLPDEWGISCVNGPWQLGPFHCRHEPLEDATAPVLAGHLHPSFRLSGKGGLSLSAPCFHFAERVAVLPAFGTFTGNHVVKPAAGDRIFLVGPDSLGETLRHSPRANPARGRRER
jgi:DNA ligase-associated metallophosphoesterase